METLIADVWVIGSGAAGVRAAISARQMGLDVCVIGKGEPAEGTASGISGGGFCGAWDDITPVEHARRTLDAGLGLCQQDLVEALVAEAPARFQEMVDWGLQIKGIPEGVVALGQGPERGAAVMRCLVDRARAIGVAFVDGLMIRALSTAEGGAYLAAYSTERGDWFALGGGAVVLAAGGAASVFSRNDSPRRLTGDAFALAFEAGAVIQDMEFMLSLPLAMAEPDLPPYLVAPTVADLGHMSNDKGEEILAKHGITERPAGSQARDPLCRALFEEIQLDGGEVRLDLTQVTQEAWCADPAAASSWEFIGGRCGAWERPLRLEPVAHFFIGGVSTDRFGATTVPGLFVAGEAAGGLHGAGRMNSNSLTEAVVFGHRAGEAAAARAAGQARPEVAEVEAHAAELMPAARSGKPAAAIGELTDRLRRAMWRSGGIVRDAEGLKSGLETVREIAEEATKTTEVNDPVVMQDFLELQMAARASGLILEAADRRRESRGTHFRRDFAQADDTNCRGHYKVVARDGATEWTFEVIT